MPICGAKTRKGGICTKPPMRDKKRCNLHGGKNPGSSDPAKGGLIHGIYSSALADDEIAIYFPVLDQIGSIEQELVIARLQLLRASKARKDWASGAVDGLIVVEDSEETNEISNDSGTYETTKRRKIKKLPDFEKIIGECLSRVGNLERIRAELIGDMVDDADTVAVKIQDALRQVATMMGDNE